MRLLLAAFALGASCSQAAECPLQDVKSIPNLAEGTCEARATSESTFVETKCAEEDNVRISLWDEKVTDFRVTARHPEVITDFSTKYTDTAPNMQDCPAGVPTGAVSHWTIGKPTDAKVLADPAADKPKGCNPKRGRHCEIRNVGEFLDVPATDRSHWHNISAGAGDNAFPAMLLTDHYITFPATLSNPEYNPAWFGAVVTVRLLDITESLELTAMLSPDPLASRLNAWTDLKGGGFSGPDRDASTSSGSAGTSVYVPAGKEYTVEFRVPDGVLGQGQVKPWTIQLHSSRGYVASFDFLKMERRRMKPPSSTPLYSSTDISVDVVKVDGWWMYPEEMSVTVNGASVTKGEYVRMVVKWQEPCDSTHTGVDGTAVSKSSSSATTAGGGGGAQGEVDAYGPDKKASADAKAAAEAEVVRNKKSWEVVKPGSLTDSSTTAPSAPPPPKKKSPSEAAADAGVSQGKFGALSILHYDNTDKGDSGYKAGLFVELSQSGDEGIRGKEVSGDELVASSSSSLLEMSSRWLFGGDSEPARGPPTRGAKAHAAAVAKEGGSAAPAPPAAVAPPAASATTTTAPDVPSHTDANATTKAAPAPAAAVAAAPAPAPAPAPATVSPLASNAAAARPAAPVAAPAATPPAPSADAAAVAAAVNAASTAASASAAAHHKGTNVSHASAADAMAALRLASETPRSASAASAASAAVPGSAAPPDAAADAAAVAAAVNAAATAASASAAAPAAQAAPATPAPAAPRPAGYTCDGVTWRSKEETEVFVLYHDGSMRIKPLPNKANRMAGSGFGTSITLGASNETCGGRNQTSTDMRKATGVMGHGVDASGAACKPAALIKTIDFILPDPASVGSFSDAAKAEPAAASSGANKRKGPASSPNSKQDKQSAAETREGVRPLAEAQVKVTFVDGSTALLTLHSSTKQTVVDVTDVTYNVQGHPFAVLSSMFISDDNQDSTHLTTATTTMQVNKRWAAAKFGVKAGSESFAAEKDNIGPAFKLHRKCVSKHNVKTPDVTVEVMCPGKTHQKVLDADAQHKEDVARGWLDPKGHTDIAAGGHPGLNKTRQTEWAVSEFKDKDGVSYYTNRYSHTTSYDLPQGPYNIYIAPPAAPAAVATAAVPSAEPVKPTWSAKNQTVEPEPEPGVPTLAPSSSPKPEPAAPAAQPSAKPAANASAGQRWIAASEVESITERRSELTSDVADLNNELRALAKEESNEKEAAKAKANDTAEAPAPAAKPTAAKKPAAAAESNSSAPALAKPTTSGQRGDGGKREELAKGVDALTKLEQSVAEKPKPAPVKAAPASASPTKALAPAVPAAPAAAVPKATTQPAAPTKAEPAASTPATPAAPAKATNQSVPAAPVKPVTASDSEAGVHELEGLGKTASVLDLLKAKLRYGPAGAR